MIEGLDLGFIRFECADEIGSGYDNNVLNGGGQPIKRLRENVDPLSNLASNLIPPKRLLNPAASRRAPIRMLLSLMVAPLTKNTRCRSGHRN